MLKTEGKARRMLTHLFVATGGMLSGYPVSLAVLLRVQNGRIVGTRTKMGTSSVSRAGGLSSGWTRRWMEPAPPYGRTRVRPPARR